MQTLVDIQAFDLPAPAVERYRAPAMSLEITVDYEDADNVAPSSDRLLRARCWVSED
jgi:hypothetical protein